MNKLIKHFLPLFPKKGADRAVLNTVVLYEQYEKGDLDRMYFKLAIFCYYKIFEKIIEILDRVFFSKDFDYLGYIKNIDSDLNTRYQYLVKAYYDFGERDDFGEIRGPDIKPFDTLVNYADNKLVLPREDSNL